jgi:NADH pyrophosphatase NudC (nudix superfamily)
VGSISVLSRHVKLQADEQFNTTMSTYHDIEQIMQHLSAQDAELLRHAKMLIHLLEKNGISLQQLEAEGATTSHLVDPFTRPQATVNAPAPSAPTDNKQQNA